ncbi:MAG TPA: hypothetical protein VMB23_08885, partial [Spirochaetia bacterium]|nr:hypothetical protein [Spirochaetia bacterium]
MTEGELRVRFEQMGADWEYSRSILEHLNSGTLVAPAIEVAGFPPLDGRQILDLRGEGPWEVSRARAESSLRALFPGEDPSRILPPGESEEVALDVPTLDHLGLR